MISIYQDLVKLRRPGKCLEGPGILPRLKGTNPVDV